MTLMISMSGIRGIVGETMTAEIAGEFAAAFGSYLDGGLVVLGRDSRPSGSIIRDAVVEKLTCCGCSVIDLGIVSTPGTALMVRDHQAAGGMVITASHNPGQWNGLKFLTHEGAVPPFSIAHEIWALREAKNFRFVPQAGRGHLSGDSSTHEKHVAAVLKIVHPREIAQRRFKVVLDSVNGAGGPSACLLLKALDCDVIHLYGEPTGQFAHPPEPTQDNLRELCEVVRREKADIGFAQDPDADRLAIVDEMGTYIGEEYTPVLAAKYMFAHYPGPAAVNLSTSRMMDEVARAAGGNCVVHRTAVGEANVVEGIKKFNCVIGGEGNGGVIDPRVVLVRDSLVGITFVLQLLTQEGRPVSAVVNDIPRYTMIKQKFECSSDKVAQALEAVKAAFADDPINNLDGIRIDWPEGWVHIRGSNTEPIMRVIAEAKEKEAAQAIIRRVAEVIEPFLDQQHQT